MTIVLAKSIPTNTDALSIFAIFSLIVGSQPIDNNPTSSSKLVNTVEGLIHRATRAASGTWKACSPIEYKV